jgi:hypothetical protein
MPGLRGTKADHFHSFWIIFENFMRPDILAWFTLTSVYGDLACSSSKNPITALHRKVLRSSVVESECLGREEQKPTIFTFFGPFVKIL